jgi:hypothetical protein
MRSKIADAVVLAVVLFIIWGGIVLCSHEQSIDTEGSCNRIAVDALAGGKPPEDVITEHARCLREKP